MITPIGEGLPQPHLLVLLRTGELTIYQAISSSDTEWPENTTRSVTLQVRFAKITSRAFEPRQTEVTIPDRPSITEQRRVLRQLVPFQTSPSPEVTLNGVFFTGEQPCWIVGSAKDGVKIHTCSYTIVHSFTACSLWDSKADFLMCTDEVRILCR